LPEINPKSIDVGFGAVLRSRSLWMVHPNGGSTILHILSIALGGCLRGEPVFYGITEDTGGHIAYILGEMRALARHPKVEHAEIVTRLFADPKLGAIHSRKREELEPGCFITRIDSGNRNYLAKDELRADRAAFTEAFIRELRQRDRLPDLIHAHFADAADVAAHAQRTLGIPYIYTAHSLGMDKLEATGTPCKVLDARIAEEDRAIARASAVIGSSRDECERQLFAYPSAQLNRIHRLIPGVSAARPTQIDLESANTLIAPFLRDPQKPVVLAIARPVHKKNLCALVEAFAPLRERANLVILAGQRSASNVGEREQVEVMTELLQLVDRHDLYGSVALPKTHTSADVAALYEIAARSRGVFVNPALIEPYGLTIVEAAAHGLPVVATKVGGPLDTISELEHGTLIDPRNIAEIGHAIAELLTDEERWSACSRNGLRNARALSWESYANNFVGIASEVLSSVQRVKPRGSKKHDKLIVSDLDNTLTGCTDGVDRLRAFLSANPDFAFAIATGRSLIEARRIVREWGIPQPAAWITSVGSEIYWSKDADYSRDRSFPCLAKARWQPELVDQVMARFPKVQPQPGYEQRAFKRSYFYSNADEVATVRSALRKAQLPVRVIASHDRLLDILPASAGKAAAMQHVAAILDIEPGCIFAAGDSGNDEDMLTACENAIIVQNHSDEIARLARRHNVYLARRSHGQGVIEGLEAHGRRRATGTVQLAIGDSR
jgi:sucrose-phosphate synthase